MPPSLTIGRYVQSSHTSVQTSFICGQRYPFTQCVVGMKSSHFGPHTSVLTLRHQGPLWLELGINQLEKNN